MSALLLLAVVNTEAKPKKLTPTITWELQHNGTLVIKGTGAIPNFEKGKAPWTKKAEKINRITIGEGITHIQDYCFYNHKKHYFDVNYFSVPSTLKNITEDAIDCYNITILQIAEGVTEIGARAFDNCRITDIILPTSLTIIGYEAFKGCKPLGIVIPKNVTYIGSDAFEGFSGELQVNCNIPRGAFMFDNFTKVTIGESVTSIGKNAFYGAKIEHISIPKSVTFIGEEAFKNCTGKLEIKCNIPNEAFRESKFTRVNIGNITRIGENAFYDSKELESITLPKSITDIGKDAFKGCKIKFVHIDDLSAWCKIRFNGNTWANPLWNQAHLNINNQWAKEIIIPSDITELKFGVFTKCKELESVTIPKNIRTIGQAAFYYCPDLKNVTIKDGTTTIGHSSFEGCKKLTTIKIPESVTSIGTKALCYTNIKELHIPNSVTYIGEYAFGDTGKNFNGKITNLPACVTRENYSKFGISKESFDTYMDNIGDPTAEVWNNKGDILREQGDYKTALSYYLKGLAAKKDGYDDGYGKYSCSFGVAMCYSHFKDYNNELKYRKMCYEMGLEYSIYHAGVIADIYTYHIIDYNRAIEWLAKSDVSDKDKKIVDLYLKTNNYTGAIEWLAKSDVSDKENKIADLYLKTNNNTGAIEWLSKGAEQGNKDTQYKLAQIYKKIGNKNKAIFWYKKAAEQKHLKAEEALADYGIFLTQQQPKQDNTSSESTKQGQQIEHKHTYQPTYQLVEEWVPCIDCGGTGVCKYCSGIGYQNGALGWSKCVICNGYKYCTMCMGKRGEYKMRERLR